MSTHEPIRNNELICLREAAKRLPSHRPGKRVHLATLYRWIFEGRLPAVRRGRWWFVRPQDLDGLTTAVRPVQLAKPCQVSQWAKDGLRRAGIA